MGKYTEKAIQLLQAKYAALGSWAAVAVDIGLKSKDRAAVHKAANGSIIARVYEALNIPYRKALAEKVRLSRIKGKVPLSGIIRYTDNHGNPQTADLSQRAKRLGTKRKEIGAKELYLFISERVTSALEKRIENGKHNL